MKNIWLSYILIFFSAMSIYGQVYITSETNVKEATNNDIISLTIALEISGEDMIQESPVKLPDFQKFEVLDYGSEQNTIIDPIRKVRVNQMVYQFLLQPKQAGTIKIGSALVKVSGKMYKSEPFDITVRDVSKRIPDNTKSLASHNNQTYLNVKLDDREVYKNQAVVATLSVISKDVDNFRKVKNIRPPKNGNIIVQPISMHRSDIEQDAKSGLLSQVIGLFIIFPKEEGMLEIPSFTAEIIDHGTTKLTSNRTKLSVMHLPLGAPEDFNDFVGNFSVDMTNVESLPQPIEINKPIDIVVKLIGRGNLSAKHMPKIIATEDYDVFPPKLVKNLKVEKQGIVGDIEAHYVVIPKKAGNIAIKTEKMAFFNPEKKLYKDLGEKSIVVRAMTPGEIENSKSTMQKVNEYTNTVLDKVNTPVLQTETLKLEKTKGMNWSIIFANMALIGAMCMVFYFVRSRYQKRKLANIIKEEQLKAQPKITTIEETEALLRQKSSLNLSSHFNYIENLLIQKKYSEFFKEFINLDNEVNAKSSRLHHIDYKEYLEKTNPKLALDYKSLLEKINIEKYSPMVNEIILESILKQIKIVYSSIED
ncbi:protein BatD [Chryseobacterium sp. POL2]|uniref:BatD family protein n=1 Tax=Chryseobacterium sp. POL2 TaxID=2713414 RepID=UPI0013E1E4A1|nr:BatD family protein [Chryseobacterium sp. POL2]QIG90694.1 protein BatD [Chryseobacterium sp. POL2]